MRSRSIAPMRAAKIGYILISAVLCVLGILLIVEPQFSAAVLGVICGIVLLVFGCVRLVGYFSKDLYRLAFQYDLPFGILLVVLGLVLLLHPAGMMNFLCITLGLYILTDSLFKIQIAADARKFGLRDWWLILALAIVSGLCGLMLLFRPGAGSDLLMILLGITLLSEGILSFSTAITAVKIIRHQRPDVIEVDYSEESED